MRIHAVNLVAKILNRMGYLLGNICGGLESDQTYEQLASRPTTNRYHFTESYLPI